MALFSFSEWKNVTHYFDFLFLFSLMWSLIKYLTSPLKGINQIFCVKTEFQIISPYRIWSSLMSNDM